MTNTEMQWIPLRALVRSEQNARTIPGSDDAMRELEASIAAHGLLENLVVRAAKDGRRKTYAVIAGGRRLQALQNLARKRRSKFTGGTEVPCRVIDEDAVDEELSLAENTNRVDMHPIDQVTTFRKLTEHGLTTRAIANRFGLTVRTVERRLRLGGVAPAILEEAKRDRLSLDHLEAFAATADQTRQMEVWNRVRNQGYPPGPAWIRSELKRDSMSAASPRARFVGVKAYKAAGGKIEVDLFGEEDDRNVRILNVRLLNELASRKLKAAAEALGGGWRWIETRLESEWNVTHWFAVLKGQPEPPTDEDHAKLARIVQQRDELASRLDDADLGGEERDKLIAEYDRLDDESQRQDEEMYGRVSYTAEQKACSGCLLTIGDEGELAMHRGLVRPADRDLIPAETDPAPAGAPAPESGPAPVAASANTSVPANDAAETETSAGTGEAAARPAANEPAPQPPVARNDYTPPICETPAAGTNRETAATHDAGLKVKTADELRVIRTALVKAQLAGDFAAAFDLAAYQLALSVFGPPRAADRHPTSLRITATADAPDGTSPHETDAFTAASPGVELLETNARDLALDWLNADDDRERFAAFRRLSLEARRNLFAAAVSRSVMPQLSFDPGARAETEAVIEALDIPFHSLYRPTLDGFWRQIGRKEMLAIADGVLGKDWAEAHASDRKDTLARAMAAAFGKETPPADAGISPEARARALQWTPVGFEPQRETASGPDDDITFGPEDADSGDEPAAAVPDWM